jgi:hypothetical protein
LILNSYKQLFGGSSGTPPGFSIKGFVHHHDVETGVFPFQKKKKKVVLRHDLIGIAFYLFLGNT